MGPSILVDRQLIGERGMLLLLLLLLPLLLQVCGQRAGCVTEEYCRSYV